MYLAAADAGEVKGVHGLAVLEHDVVGDIDDVIYRTHAGVADTLAHPLGRGGDLHVFDHARGVARAEAGVLDDDLRHVVDVAACSRLYDGFMELQLLAEGDGRLAGKADHAQAVWTVGGYLELNDVVVAAHELCHIVAGLHVLVKDEYAVAYAVGKLLLFCVEVLKGADGAGGGIVGDHIARVEVLAWSHALRGRLKFHLPEVYAGILHGLYLRRDDLAEDSVSRLYIGGNGGLFGVERLIVAEYGGGLYLAVGEVVSGRVQLFERAEHTVGLDAAEFSAAYLHAAGEDGVMERGRDKVSDMDVPRAGAYLDRLALSHVDLSDQHMVGVGVLFYGEYPADADVFHLLAEILGDLHLGAGDGHGLGKDLIVVFVKGKVDKLVEPFS